MLKMVATLDMIAFADACCSVERVAVCDALCNLLLCSPARRHISVVLCGILAPALLHHLLQSACCLQMLVLGYQLLPLCFTALQVEGLLALLDSCTLFCLQVVPHFLSWSQ